MKPTRTNKRERQEKGKEIEKEKDKKNKKKKENKSISHGSSTWIANFHALLSIDNSLRIFQSFKSLLIYISGPHDSIN
uniref:Uncharacterized protein n=1 Tax=Arundo donax TaxID=35708 RepID=A0A0A8Z7E2_ARUDO